MSKSVLELAVGTGQWNAGLKKAKSALDNFTQSQGGLQQALAKDSDSMQKFVRMMGQADSTAKTAKGQMNDYKSTIEQLTMQYNRMTDAQKKTIGQDYLHAIDQMKQKYQFVNEEIQEMNRSLNNVKLPDMKDGVGGLFSGMGDKMSGALQVFAGNMLTKAAGAVANLGSEMVDMVQQGVELAKQGEGIRIAFERLGRGDILDGLREATHGTVTDIELMKAAVKFNDFKLPLDELGTMLAFAQQKAKDTGQSVDYMVDSIVTGLGRKSLMILDNLGLSANEVKEKMAETGDMTKAVGEIIREQMSKAGDYVETAADRAAQANVSLQNKMEELGRKFGPLQEASNNFWTSMKIGILDIVGGPLARLLNGLTEAGRLKNMLNDMNGGGGGAETNTERQLRILREYSGGGKGIEGKRDLYNRQIAEYRKKEEKAWRDANRLREELKGLREQQTSSGFAGNLSPLISEASRQLEAAENRAKAIQVMRANYEAGAKGILNPSSPASKSLSITSTGKTGGKSGKDEEEAAIGSIDYQTKKVQELQKAWRAAADDDSREKIKQQIEEQQYVLDKMTGKEKFDPSKMKEIKGTSLLPEINDSTIDAQTKKVQQLQEAWRAAADDDSREKIKKEIEEQQYVLDRMTGKRSSLLPEINDSTIDAQTKKVQQLQEAWRAAANDDSRKKIKEELESAQKVLDNMNIRAKKPVLRDPLEGLKTMKQSIQLELKTEAVKVDENTLHTLMKDALQNGINGMDIQFNAIGEKIGKGIDVPESTWDKIIEEYNSVREQLGMEPITIDIKTGNMKEIGNDAKVVKGSFKEAASAVGSLGSALSGLDDPGAKIAGTVAQAIANIALAFSSADLKEGEKGNVWYWIAATAAGLATMVSTISSIHAATNYAEGGMIKGNSYSGDNILGMNNSTGELVGLNAGEIVLNRAQQGNLLSQGSGGGFNGQIVGMIEGEKIVLVANRYFKRSGQGEIVTWKN